MTHMSILATHPSSSKYYKRLSTAKSYMEMRMNRVIKGDCFVSLKNVREREIKKEEKKFNVWPFFHYVDSYMLCNNMFERVQICQ